MSGSFIPADFNVGALDLNDKSILVTGGTGSFGQKLVRTILARYTPRRLAIYSRDELKQYEMANSLPQTEHPFLRYFIGDVRDSERLEMAMRDIDYVIHAAALKQVSIAEYNPFECIHTNVLGAENVVRAAIRAGVERVLALSTDKAANPINLYGASKLASDKIFIAANNLSGQKMTRFSVVRYGNVIGSRGSVVPLFRKLAEEGVDSIPITDPRMTRFWITLQQGVDFVLSSMNRMRGGEIFVPKIPSTVIGDLAAAIAPDVPTKTVGIRPGEKLHEVMITEDDSRNTVEFPDHYVIEPSFAWWARESHLDAGSPVDEGFRYASDTNDQRLGIEAIRILLENIGQ
jgi:UDP-N-acetylglucosamine 4,6-dehydratase